MRVKQLTKNQLKILAMVCMTIDHIGAAFFPQAVWLRVIGRLAFPLFSYCIAEGCRYTRNKACGNALITLSMSILLLYGMEAWKSSGKLRFLALTAALAAVFYLLCRTVPIDYGFAGVLLPLYAEIGRLFWERVFAGIPPVIGERLGFAVGLLALAGVMGGLQRFCVLAIFPLLLLGNERGKWKMKHFFYIYYPAHLAVIGAVRMALEAAAG